MLIVTPPAKRFTTGLGRSVFLAGSIEMGAAEEWQTRVLEDIKDRFAVAYNPRRPDWDASWEQKLEHPEFNAQVNWELDMIERADVVGFYFDPATKSPITLMELGYALALKPRVVVVACPEGFWRKGNVDIICEREGIRVLDTLDGLVEALRQTSIKVRDARS